MDHLKGVGKILLGLLLIAGAYGVYLRLTTGHTLAGYGSYMPWGLWVAAYIYFAGLSAGSFLIFALASVFRIKALAGVEKHALFTALVTLFAALLTIGLDLGHMGRFVNVYLSPNPLSMMTWMVWLYTGFSLLLAAAFWIAVRADMSERTHRKGLTGLLARVLSLGADPSPEGRARDAEILRALGMLGIVLVVFFSGGVGALFGVIAAKPFWNSGLMPVLFLVSASLSGAAALTFLSAVFPPDTNSEPYRRRISFLAAHTLGLLTAQVLLEWADASISIYSGIPHHSHPWLNVLFGSYWYVFWIGYVGMGILVPGTILALRRTKPAWAAAAAAMIALALFAVRLNIVIPAQATPPLAGLENAFSHPRLVFAYFPSSMEWLVLVFIVSLAASLILAGSRYLPLVNQR